MLQYLFTKTPLLFLTQPFWRDEAFSYFMAKKNIIEMFFLTAKDFNPPLYYLILHFWINIFGSSEIALRSLSLFFFWATICIVFLFLVNIFRMRERKASMYLILFVINPLLLYYAFEARMYSMFAFFVTLSFYAFYRKNNRLYLLATIAGLFTHYFMMFVILAQLLFLFINKENIDFVKKKTIYLSLLAFSPWLVFSLSQKNFLTTSFWLSQPKLKYIFGFLGLIYTGNESAFYSNALIFKGIQNNILYLSLIFTLILLIGIYSYTFVFNKKEKINFQLFFLWAICIPLIVGIISFIKPIYLPRYLIFTSIGFILLTIFIVEKINIVLRMILLGLIIAFTLNYNQLQLVYRKKYDLKKSLKEIQIIAKKNDYIYLTDELDFFTAEYYINDNNIFIYGKSYQEIPGYVGKVLIPEEKVAISLPFYPQKAFILKSNGQYTIQALF